MQTAIVDPNSFPSELRETAVAGSTIPYLPHVTIARRDSASSPASYSNTLIARLSANGENGEESAEKTLGVELERAMVEDLEEGVKVVETLDLGDLPLDTNPAVLVSIDGITPHHIPLNPPISGKIEGVVVVPSPPAKGWTGVLPAFTNGGVTYPPTRASVSPAASGKPAQLEGVLCSFERWDPSAGKCKDTEAECAFCKYMKVRRVRA